MTDEQLFQRVRTSGCRESLEELKRRYLDKTSRYLASFETGAGIGSMLDEVFSRILKGRYPDMNFPSCLWHMCNRTVRANRWERVKYIA